MEEILKQRDIIEYREVFYRILEVENYHVLTIAMNTPKTIIRMFNRHNIEAELSCGMAHLKEDAQESVRYIHPELLTGSSHRIYTQYKHTGEKFLAHARHFSWLLDRQEKAEFIEKLAKENKMSLATARRRLRDYLQNGMTLRGLEAKYYRCGGKGKERVYQTGNRPGRIGRSAVVRDEETIRIFDKMTRRYIALHGKRSIAGIYKEMLESHYAEKVAAGAEFEYIPYSVSATPTKKQLYYHISKKVGSVEDYIMRNGFKDARNNKRPLYSDTIYALEHQTIGDCYELDEMETDYELVSSYDRNQVIGRAIMYLITDVFSKMITGYAVGIDNNSWAGVEMLLLNMAEDKVEHCAERGIAISEEEWPVSHVLPREILVDNGSEHLSEQFKHYIAENGMCLSHVESRMGSMKGNIEGEFRRFNLKTNGLLPGQIIKDAYRNPHEKQARLTIEEFEKIVIRFILNHNMNPMTSYKANKEIFEAGVVQSPNKIWEYCLKQPNQLRKINDMDAYRLSILCTGQARITREGIQFQKLLYSCEDENWLSYQMSCAAIEKSKKLSIKYDKRCMDVIYYLSDDGTYKPAFLNERKTVNEKYRHLSYDEVLSINCSLRKINQEYEMVRNANDVKFIGETKAIVKQAEKMHKGSNTSKDKREKRLDTKARLHKEHNVVSKMDSSMKAPSIGTNISDNDRFIESVKFVEQVNRQRLLRCMNLVKMEE